MLKNLASLGASGAVQSGASRIVMDMRPKTNSLIRMSATSYNTRTFHPQSAPPEVGNASAIDNRRHCMGPSVGSSEPEKNVRKLRFTAKCPRLTVVKNLSNPSLAQSVEVKQSRPTSCPQKIPPSSSSPKSLSVSADKEPPKNAAIVQNILKSNLGHSGYIRATTPVRAKAYSQRSSPDISRKPSKIDERADRKPFSHNSPKPSDSSSRRLLKIDLSPYGQKSSLKTPTDLKIETPNHSRTIDSQRKKSILDRSSPNNIDIFKKAFSVDKTSNSRATDSHYSPKSGSLNLEFRKSAHGVRSNPKIENTSVNNSISSQNSFPVKRKRILRASRSDGDTYKSLITETSSNTSLPNKLNENSGKKPNCYVCVDPMTPEDKASNQPTANPKKTGVRSSKNTTSTSTSSDKTLHLINSQKSNEVHVSGKYSGINISESRSKSSEKIPQKLTSHKSNEKHISIKTSDNAINVSRHTPPEKIPLVSISQKANERHVSGRPSGTLISTLKPKSSETTIPQLLASQKFNEKLVFGKHSGCTISVSRPKSLKKIPQESTSQKDNERHVSGKPSGSSVSILKPKSSETIPHTLSSQNDNEKYALRQPSDISFKALKNRSLEKIPQMTNSQTTNGKNASRKNSSTSISASRPKASERVSQIPTSQKANVEQYSTKTSNTTIGASKPKSLEKMPEVLASQKTNKETFSKKPSITTISASKPKYVEKVSQISTSQRTNKKHVSRKTSSTTTNVSRSKSSEKVSQMPTSQNTNEKHVPRKSSNTTINSSRRKSSEKVPEALTSQKTTEKNVSGKLIGGTVSSSRFKSSDKMSQMTTSLKSSEDYVPRKLSSTVITPKPKSSDKATQMLRAFENHMPRKISGSAISALRPRSSEKMSQMLVSMRTFENQIPRKPSATVVCASRPKSSDKMSQNRTSLKTTENHKFKNLSGSDVRALATDSSDKIPQIKSPRKPAEKRDSGKPSGASISALISKSSEKISEIRSSLKTTEKWIAKSSDKVSQKLAALKTEERDPRKLAGTAISAIATKFKNSETARQFCSHRKVRRVYSVPDARKLHPGAIHANKQISMLYKDKFDPAILDRFRARNFTAFKHHKIPRQPPDQSTHSQSGSLYPRSERLGVERRSSYGSNLVRAFQTRSNSHIKNTHPFLPGGSKRPDNVRPGTKINQALSTDGMIPLVKPSFALVPTKSDKGTFASKSKSKSKNDKLLSKSSKRDESEIGDEAASATEKAGGSSDSGRGSGVAKGGRSRGGSAVRSSSLKNIDSILSGTQAVYLERMFLAWSENPQSVHPSWDAFFRRIRDGAPLSPQTVSASSGVVSARTDADTCPTCLRSLSDASAPDPAGQLKVKQQMALQNIVNHYQTLGHLQAEIDPLQFRGPALGTQFVKAADRKWPERVVQLLHENQMTDLKQQFMLPLETSIGKLNEISLPLGEVLNRLQDTYCQYMGIEFMHISDHEKRKWIREQFEPGMKNLTSDEKKKVWKHLLQAACFEKYLSRKWPTTFRFSLEGCEILVPVLQQILDRSVETGTDTIVLGMAHRGRLNVMANILNKDIDKLLLHFRKDVRFEKHLGDVKYHLGCYITQKHEGTNKDITICIVSNASHLESVNPMVQGRCKAEQIILNDHEGKRVLPIVVHGDAAYAGQGVVYEHNTMSTLPDYDVHGTIHLVINNNIGFTTPPEESRSSPYCTDIAKLVNAPVFHVNSEKPDEVIHCINTACAYRNRFHRDVVVDLICYRRLGHNEADEPAFTSPKIYSEIRTRPSFPDKYTQLLLKDKIISQEDVDKETEAYYKKCEEALKKSETYTSIDWKDWNDSPWKDFAAESTKEELVPTGVPEDVLKSIAHKSMEVPEKFAVHKLLTRVFQNRKKMVESGFCDWALGETLAFGSLLIEGVPIRLAGQDSQRGTFSHRHHVLHHQEKDKEKYVPLNHLSPKQGRYNVLNSPLIEYGSLAFEMGYAMSFGNALCLCEGQYGDFLNNGQLIIDAYLSGGESKWGRQCGLVILAPHGMEGLGSEHSSARLERYLQLSSEEPDLVSDMNKPGFSYNQLKNTNWIVANCTTPANYFHILRRQIKLPFRKPLIIMSPKSLLRHPECKSSLTEMTEKTSFKPIIPDMGAVSKNPETVKKHIICSGKVYYDLIETRQKHHLDSSIAITRIEQLCPFPFHDISKEINKYSSAEICWVQEEHKNQGAWNFILDRLNALLFDTNWYAISYVGRAVSPVPAVATMHRHIEEREEFLQAAMITEEDLEHRGIKVDKFSPTKKR